MMRIRKSNAVSVLCVIGIVLFMIYLVKDTINLQYAESDLQKEEISHLEAKLNGLETDLVKNQKTIEKIRDIVAKLKEEQTVIKAESKAIRAKGKSPVNKTFASVSKMDLAFASEKPLQCDIQMDKVYDELPFDNPDGGVWKQGWDITYDQSEVLKPENKLKVFVMPHSHNDPGWIKTFEEYFNTQTKKILDNMVVKLSENKRRKFVWAEVSFFAMWWVGLDAPTQLKVKDLLSKGQLEIVTGGWVMNDEANTYYYAMIEQLLLGHEWCQKNLNGYKPNNGWAIDPFGMSPTMAYLLKRIGFDNMLIQRTHYSVKKYLAKHKDLEFRWRQHWDHKDSTDILAHMMPFYSYDVPHTCGPDPKVCCQFDFARLPGSRITCPWKVPPQAITPANVADRAKLLLDQYRKKASLYKTNSVLIPLGDDFRYTTADEWDNQYNNYEAIFEYVNSHPELNAEMSFGTLQDYFSSVRRYSLAKTQDTTGLFKSLSGDFFTYADRNDNYWSGYYTSRPFYKNMDRVLEGYLRAAEIMFSMSWAEMEYVGSDFPEFATELMTDLVIARQNLALFQHHDGVTGTAKDHVVVDYGNKMLTAITRCQNIMSQSANYLLTSSKAFYKPNLKEKFYDLDDFRERHNSLPQQTVIEIDHPDAPSKVVIFNSQAKYRTETVTLRISDPNVRVYKINDIDGDEEEEDLQIQLSPVFDSEGQISNNEFEMSFLAQLKGFALKTYFVQAMRPEEGSNPNMDVAKITIHNSVNHPFQARPFDEPEVYETGDEFTLQNGYIRARFSSSGMLQEIETLDDRVKSKCLLEIIQYGTAAHGDKSGAYLFMPNGNAKVMTPTKPLVRIIDGKVLSYVEVFTPWMRHVVTLKSSPGPDGTGLQINNDVDIRKMNNFEIGMRFSTDIESGQEFFTDLNGLSMIKRKRLLEKLPLQANYYPIPSMTYIQDSDSRLTLITKQPLGGSSLKPGQIEILMDRRLMQDDNRGLFQGVTDTHITPHTFYLVLERKIQKCSSDEPKDSVASYPSLLSLSLRHGIINPMHKLISVSKLPAMLNKEFEPVGQDASCDIEVVNLRTMIKYSNSLQPGNQAALIIHRQGFNACYKPIGMTCSTNGGKISVESMFPELYGDQMKQTSLTTLHDGVAVQKGFTISINAMEVYSFLLKR